MTVKKNIMYCYSILFSIFAGSISWSKSFIHENKHSSFIESYADIRLLENPFTYAMELDLKWLKEVDVDRFLHAFRINAGLATKAKALSGWELLDCEVHEFSSGYVLSGLALMYVSTDDIQYATKGTEFTKALAECQQALASNGYLSAFPENYLNRLIKGENCFYEIYNEATGKTDGGWQQGRQWKSVYKQTWSATGYMRMVFNGLLGISFSASGNIFS